MSFSDGIINPLKMPAVAVYLVLGIPGLTCMCILFYIPPQELVQSENRNVRKGWGTLLILLIGMATSLLCFVFSKLFFSQRFVSSISSSIIEYNVLMNNVYWYGSELLSPMRSIKYPISYFGLHAMSYFSGLYAVSILFEQIEHISSSYNLSHDRLKLQFMCLGLFMFFETLLLYVSYPFQTFASGWRIFHNIFAVFLAETAFYCLPLYSGLAAISLSLV